MSKKITIKTILKNLDAVITATTLTLCVILVNLNVLMRYVFNHPLQWSEEIVTSLFVWTVFIGSAYAYRTHSHLGVDILVNRLHGTSKTIVSWIVTIIELGILVMVTIISTQYVYHLIYVRGHFKPAVTDVLRIPKAYTGIAVPIGFALSTIYSIYFILSDKLHIIKKKELPEDSNAHKVEGGNF